MAYSWEEMSKKSWRTVGLESPADETDAHVQIGCLQRIASAVEKTAENWSNLEAERDRYKVLYHDTCELRSKDFRRCVALGRQNSALKGVITKLKQKSKKEDSK